MYLFLLQILPKVVWGEGEACIDLSLSGTDEILGGTWKKYAWGDLTCITVLYPRCILCGFPPRLNLLNIKVYQI